MCEVCREGWSEETKIPKTDGFACEFSTEQNPTACGAPATYKYREQVVDDHLCEPHAQELAQDLGEGLMSLFQHFGAADGETLKPIQTAGACDKCGEPARYAEVVITTIYFCGRHRGSSE